MRRNRIRCSAGFGLSARSALLIARNHYKHFGSRGAKGARQAMCGHEGELQTRWNIAVTYTILYPELKYRILVIGTFERQLTNVVEPELYEMVVEGRLGTLSPLKCMET